MRIGWNWLRRLLINERQQDLACGIKCMKADRGGWGQQQSNSWGRCGPRLTATGNKIDKRVKVVVEVTRPTSGCSCVHTEQ
jgi:hypothetical protein